LNIKTKLSSIKSRLNLIVYIEIATCYLIKLIIITTNKTPDNMNIATDANLHANQNFSECFVSSTLYKIYRFSKSKLLTSYGV